LHTTTDGTAFNILQETLYPFEDQVRFTVEAAAPVRLTLWLRRPAWASAFHLEGIESAERDGWIVIEREWHGRRPFTLRFDVPVRTEPYPAGEVAVLRGPLQFVQAIPHRVRVLPVPARAEWPDSELLADVHASIETLPIIDASRPDLGFTPDRAPTTEPDRPWHDPPLRLRSNGITLVPLGCAPLRRADFRAYSGNREDEA
jgi:DUF1680 family protein